MSQTVDATGIGTVEQAIEAMGSGPLTEAGLREHVFPLFSRVLQREEIYLANHSLGRPLDRSADDVRTFMDLWYADMDTAWEAWLAEIAAFRANVARLIGCGRPDAVVHKVSAGQGLRAVLNASPTKGPVLEVVSTRSEFDAVDIILKAYASKGRARVSWVDPTPEALVDARAIVAGISEKTDVVVLSQVYFNTGQVLEGVDEVVAAARRVGAAVVLDTYHGAGVVPGVFDELGVDFAIGGNYKYTRGGPGASWLAIREDHLDDAAWQPIDTGWFAKDAHFDFARSDELRLAPGGDGWNEGTPAPLIAYQAKAGLEFVLCIGVDRLRAYSILQQDRLAGLLADQGVAVRPISPRGAFLLVEAPNHARVRARLKDLGVNCDSRTDALGRGVVRLCPDVLNTDEELARAAGLVAAATRG